jgi:Flp pilus assembly pilin Flp
MMDFLRDEGGSFRIEYAVLGVIIVLAILAVVAALTKKGK